LSQAVEHIASDPASNYDASAGYQIVGGMGGEAIATWEKKNAGGEDKGVGWIIGTRVFQITDRNIGPNAPSGDTDLNQVIAVAKQIYGQLPKPH
jgi:hypothetical protein